MYWMNGSKVRVAMLLAAGCLVGLLILPGIAYAQDDVESGDAPSSYNNVPAETPTDCALMTAYPWLDPGSAKFPVVSPLHGAPPTPDGYGICHAILICSHLGSGKSWEKDADLLPDDDPVTNIDPANDIADRDGYDDGVAFPPLMPSCDVSYIAVNGEVLTEPSDRGLPMDRGYINVWADWNRDGDWNDTDLCACDVDEWAVRDVEVQPGPFSLEIPVVACHPFSETDPVWVRVSLSELSIGFLSLHVPGDEWFAGGMPPDFEGCIGEGETEDYYVRFQAPPPEVEFVPEWGSIALLGSGLMGMAGYASLRWRKR
jgi:hypothetical protein